MKKKTMKYNPAFLTEQELVDAFVVREAEMREVVEIIRRNNDNANQHVLIVGPRGSGKTMFVLRVAAAVNQDAELSQRWLPIPFAEESYSVSTPGEFWLETIFHIGKITRDSRWDRLHAELLEEMDEEILRKKALSHLMDFADKQNKRLLLVVENLNMLLDEQMTVKDGWVLRDTLQNEPRIMILASATSQRKMFQNNKLAMFEIFRDLELQPLDEEDSKTLWSSVTGIEIETRKIRPIQILTGGSPRLITIIANFCTDLCLQDLMAQMINLVDDHTDYFKSNLESLAVAERQAYLGLAEIWDPAGAGDVGKKARQHTNTASANLKRLVEKGLVLVAGKKGKAQLYQISERLYNIYYLMRRSGKPADRVKVIVKFMLDFYEEEEYPKIVQAIANESLKLCPNSRQDHFHFIIEFLKNPVVSPVLDDIVKNIPIEIIEQADTPKKLKNIISNTIFFDYLQYDDHDFSYIIDLLLAKDSKEKGIMYLQEAYVKHPNHPIILTAVGTFIYLEDNSILEAEDAYRKAIAINPKFALAWSLLANLLHEKLNEYEESETAYREAIALEPEFTPAWWKLGQLLHEKLNRYCEAEEAYKKALSMDPKLYICWVKLANLYHYKLDMFEKAEHTYRKAIELNPNNSWLWLQLGTLLQENVEHFNEAKEAFEHAIEFDKENAEAWLRLGHLSYYHYNNYKDAEIALKNAASITPDIYQIWLLLGDLVEEHFNDYKLAEVYYKKSINCDNNNYHGYIMLLSVYLKTNKSKQHIVNFINNSLIDYKDNHVLYNGFAWHCYDLGDTSYLIDAEHLARKAIELQPDISTYQHTFATILAAQGKIQEALEPMRIYLADKETVEKNTEDATTLIVEMAANGGSREALEVLEESPSAYLLEPLVVGLKLDLGEEVLIATEILEIGKDVKKRIDEKRAERNQGEEGKKRKKGKESDI